MTHRSRSSKSKRRSAKSYEIARIERDIRQRQNGNNGSRVSRDGKFSAETDSKIIEYLRAEDIGQRLKIAAFFRKGRSAGRLAISGGMYLDLANDPRATDPEYQFRRAEDALTQSIAIDPSLIAKDDHVAKGALSLANIALYRNLFIGRSNSGTDAQEAAHQRTIALATSLSRIVNAMPEGSADNPNTLRSRFIGTLGECAVLLLLQRHGLTEATDSEWMPLPTTLSQDRALRQKDSPRNNYDISVFTQYDPILPPKETYKLEVKTGGIGKSLARTYAEDITLVSVLGNLRLDGEGQDSLPSLTIPFECATALGQTAMPEFPHGELVAEEFLQQRTAQLLDIID